MTPRQTVEKWVAAFNDADINALQNLYAVDAIIHQMPKEPVQGREAIANMFSAEFAAAPSMHCIPKQIISEGDWAVLEWSDPKGFRGCGFFYIKNGFIQIQRGYWDRLSFNELYGIDKE